MQSTWLRPRAHASRCLNSAPSCRIGSEVAAACRERTQRRRSWSAWRRHVERRRAKRRDLCMAAEMHERALVSSAVAHCFSVGLQLHERALERSIYATAAQLTHDLRRVRPIALAWLERTRRRLQLARAARTRGASLVHAPVPRVVPPGALAGGAHAAFARVSGAQDARQPGYRADYGAQQAVRPYAARVRPLAAQNERRGSVSAAAEHVQHAAQVAGHGSGSARTYWAPFQAPAAQPLAGTVPADARANVPTLAAARAPHSPGLQIAPAASRQPAAPATVYSYAPQPQAAQPCLDPHRWDGNVLHRAPAPNARWRQGHAAVMHSNAQVGPAHLLHRQEAAPSAMAWSDCMHAPQSGQHDRTQCRSPLQERNCSAHVAQTAQAFQTAPQQTHDAATYWPHLPRSTAASTPSAKQHRQVCAVPLVSLLLPKCAS
jgi:hypothetical protein